MLETEFQILTLRLYGILGGHFCFPRWKNGNDNPYFTNLLDEMKQCLTAVHIVWYIVLDNVTY